MSFANLIFLLGAIGVAGPILAHLLIRPRYRRVPFTMLSFLQVGRREMQSRRNLRNVLMLLLRCAIIFVLAMLFAGPRWVSSAPKDQQDKQCFIGFDDSYSMTYSDGGTAILDQMIERACDAADAAEPEVRFSIYGLASGRRWLGLDKSLVKASLRSIKAVCREVSLDDYLSDIRQAERQSSSEISVWVFSDFTDQVIQRIQHVETPVRVKHYSVFAAAMREPTDNLAIIDAKVQGVSDHELQVVVTTANYGRSNETRKLQATLDGRVFPGPEISLASGGGGDLSQKSSLMKIPFALSDKADSDFQYAPVEFSLAGSDGLSGDDRYYYSVCARHETAQHVLLAGKDERQMFLLITAMDTLSRSTSGAAIEVTALTADAFTPSSLKGINVFVCTDIWPMLESQSDSLKMFAQQGGRWIVFTSPESPLAVGRSLYDKGILGACPVRYCREETRIQTDASEMKPDALSGDGQSRFALSLYDLGRMAFCGYYEYEPSESAQCLWSLNRQQGFLYYMPLGQGSVVQVNTSADASMGMLAKSPAMLAFCRYLLGSQNPIHVFSNDIYSPVMFPCSALEKQAYGDQQPIWIQQPSGQLIQGRLTEGMICLDTPEEIGWHQTPHTPVRYAGVNVPAGETLMVRPPDSQIDCVLDQAFYTDQSQSGGGSDDTLQSNYQPIWKWFAMLLIGLVSFEAFLANRMKR